MNDFLDKLIGYLIIGVIGTIFLFPYIGRRKQTKEELRESSIEKIKKEKNLDIQYEINKEGVVIFKKTKEKINQIAEILKDENNKVTEIYLGYNDLGSEGGKYLEEVKKIRPEIKIIY
jgi:hypothetical protein